MHSHEPLHSLFARHGLRCTKPRQAIFHALSQSKAHPSADQLYKQISSELDGVSLATVYNTLDAFVAAGLARKMPGTQFPDGRTGPTRYDACVHSHPHLRCQASGELHDVPDELGARLLTALPPDVLKDIEQRLGFRIDHVQIELVGEYRGT